MAHSLSAECTPLKHAYDACFNSWFEGYLEPLVSSAGSSSPATKEERNRRTKAKAEEYESKCGAVWKSYRDCVQKAVADKGLGELLNQAREDNPLQEPIPKEDSDTSSHSS